LLTDGDQDQGNNMARKVEVKLLDDTDGSTADETVTFGLDGSNYEIDLSHKNAERLRAELEKFLHAARRVGRGGIAPTRRGRAAAAPAKADRAQNQAIRDWAKRKGIQLSERGRIPRNVIEQYEGEAGR
jgi:nucleoid-associated protein Lsr2